ncbi:hypothetical protein [Serratia sp. BW106]|uniref:hypothetical protein n=1 Tax=Serratia sp. BW106 TaxID=1884636 RepID=UPI000BFFD5F1|nr:hypothetical protein [Serratia sp. BW106]
MPLFYTNASDLCKADVISYATDSLLADIKIELSVPVTRDFLAGSILDKSTGGFATASSTSENIFVILEKTFAGEKFICAARPFGVVLIDAAMIAGAAADLDALKSVLSAQGFSFATCGVYTS